MDGHRSNGDGGHSDQPGLTASSSSADRALLRSNPYNGGGALKLATTLVLSLLTRTLAASPSSPSDAVGEWRCNVCHQHPVSWPSGDDQLPDPDLLLCSGRIVLAYQTGMEHAVQCYHSSVKCTDDHSAVLPTFAELAHRIESAPLAHKLVQQRGGGAGTYVGDYWVSEDDSLRAGPCVSLLQPADDEAGGLVSEGAFDPNTPQLVAGCAQ